jgi:DNA-binding MarR family transcriptional regulator
MKPAQSAIVTEALGASRRSGQPRLGAALRGAWVGYQRQLDDAMVAAGFGDRGFPDGRVLRMCRDTPGITTAQIGRELGITRQGAAKIVAGLRDRGYVSLEPSSTSAREKVVTIAPRAVEYLDAQRTAARSIERDLHLRLGADGVDALHRLLDALGADETFRLRDYLRQKGVREL